MLNKDKVKEIASSVANTVIMKDAAYGEAFKHSGEVLKLMYPNGIPADQLHEAAAIVRVLDKLFRIATANDPMGESPWSDIAGYSLLKLVDQTPDKAQKTGSILYPEAAPKVKTPLAEWIETNKGLELKEARVTPAREILDRDEYAHF